MNFWWGYALGSYSRGGGGISGGNRQFCIVVSA